MLCAIPVAILSQIIPMTARPQQEEEAAAPAPVPHAEQIG
jgi:PAT family beta-lactamase induction signal transducer AmpG